MCLALCKALGSVVWSLLGVCSNPDSASFLLLSCVGLVNCFTSLCIGLSSGQVDMCHPPSRLVTRVKPVPVYRAHDAEEGDW
jgi:hypothetical protein